MGTQQTVAVQEKQRSISLSTVLLLLALLVAVLAAWPLLSEPGFLNTRGGGDSPFLLQRLQQLETALRDGHFPVRWMPDANYGYGYPFFNFYAPLSIYIAVVFRFLGFSIVHSLELAQLAGFLAAAWGIFLLGRRWLKSEWAGLLAAVAYTVAPFHLVNIYVRGDSLAEFWAMAWYPWILLAADKLLDYKGIKFPYGPLAAFAAAYAALILSHNISALIFTPFLLLLLLVCGAARRAAPRAPDKRANGVWSRIWLAVLLAVLLALGLAAWFFIPALAEQELAQLEPVTSGFFHYSNHFRGMNLVQPTLLFDYSVSGGRAFRLGLAQAIITGLGALALIIAAWRKRLVSPSIALFILLSLLVATFMITPLSRFLWDHLPLLSFTQFPWRFLSVQAFAGALSVSALALLPHHRIIVPLTAILLLVSSMAGLKSDHLLLADEDISAERLAEYEWFTGNIGSTVSAEYLPAAVQPRPYTSSWLISGARGNVSALHGDLLHARPIEWKTGDQTWQIKTAESDATLLFPTLYWPGWLADVDGEAVELQPAPGSGLIMLDLAPGEHIVRLQLGKTKVRRTAELISLAAVLLLLFSLIKARRRPQITAASIMPLVLFLICLSFVVLRPQKPLSASNRNWDFAQMGYLHHADSGVPFDNGAVLQRYEYDSDTFLAGDKVGISLEFSAADGEEVTLALGTPASAWPAFDPHPPPIAEQTQIVTNQQAQFEFLLPENVPAGRMIPRLLLTDARPLTSSGKTRGDIYLRPLRIINERPAEKLGLELDVRPVKVLQREPDVLEVQLAWIARRQLSHNYNVSLRLLDEDGTWLSQLDVQPGYGFLPSSSWPVGMEVDDWLAMSLPPELPQDTPLPLVLRLYEVGSDEVVFSNKLGDVTVKGDQLIFQENEPVFNLPGDLQPLPVIFGEGIRLHGYQIEQSGPELSVTLYWEALTAGQPDYTRFVHLFDPQTDGIVLQSDGQPRNDSYPTSQWTVGEIVADTTIFDLSAVAPGSYRLGVGFYRQEGESLLHLTAVDPQTQTPVLGNRAILPAEISK